MKKHLGNISFFITILMCVMILFGCRTINSKAATTQPSGTLYQGDDFNITLKQFVNSSCQSTYYNDSTIKKIVFTHTKPSTNLNYKKIGVNVTAHYDNSQGIVYIYSPSTIIFSPSCKDMFARLTALENIDFGHAINMNNVKDMQTMFDHCSMLKALETSYFKGCAPKNMQGTFMNCRSLKQLDATNFDTSNVITMNQTFCYCTGLTSLDVSKFDTSKVTNMRSTFRGLSGVKYLDLSNFNTTYVRYMDTMFGDCSSLTELDLSGFDTSDVRDMMYMFYNCSSLKTLNISSFDLSSIKNNNDIENFFSCCYKLKNIYAPKKIVNPLAYDYTSKHWMIPSGPIGKIVLDDNDDGIPDNKTEYDKIPVADKSHKYLVVNALGAAKEEPTPEKPTPEKPTPEEPSPEEPTPEKPTPEEPSTPEEPTTPEVTPDENAASNGASSTSTSNGTTVAEPESTVPAGSGKAENIDSNQKTTKITSLKAGKKYVTVTWKKIKGVNGYEIQYSTDKAFQKNVKSVTAGKAKTKLKIIKKLKRNKKYYFRIRTFKNSGSEKIYSKWSKKCHLTKNKNYVLQ